jgi:hypothetical protein
LQSSPEDANDPRLTQHPPGVLCPYVSHWALPLVSSLWTGCLH